MRAVAVCGLLLTIALAGCTSPSAPAPPPTPPAVQAPSPGFNPIVKLTTDMGAIYIEVYEEMAPLTAENFLGYVRSHFYDGLRVHRVVKDFVIQMGDPNTRDPTKPKTSWGTGDPNLKPIPDEFNSNLRHDAAGVVSMAISGPDTGTSQFFITLAPTPGLDDKHSVFGRVAVGLDVVQAIGNVPTATVGNTKDIPVQDIVIRSTSVIEPDRPASAIRHNLSGFSHYTRYNSTANHILQFIAVVENTGTVRETVTPAIEAPAEWTFQVPCPRATPSPDCPYGPLVGAGASQAFFFQLRTPGNVTEVKDFPVTVTFSSSGATARVPLTIHVGTLGRAPQDGDNVSVEYVGTFPDGRLFDTSLKRVESNAAYPSTAFLVHDARSEYRPLDFILGSRDLIEGFTLGTRYLREGEIGATLIPPAQAYGLAVPGNTHRLAGRWLAFTIELRAIQGT